MRLLSALLELSSLRWLALPFLVSGLLISAPALAGAPSAWERTLDHVTPAVVAIRVTATRDFDTDRARSAVGTGFVVDSEQGIVLTNRHIVHAGPVVAEAVFLNDEEVPLRPVYRDPIHDFGFYQFDPADVRHMDLVALELAPDAARVGMEIRVIGNDNGEKVSILDGTIARLDRNAPDYGRGSYNDFNTFYLQAASNTSGGSSGSPVVAVDGRVVALNAGGSLDAASSFFLPLPRVQRALEHIRRGEHVDRGTLEVTFKHATFEELRRLRLQPATEAALRSAGVHAGTLIVSDTIPGTPAASLLQPGDILLSIDGVRTTDFVVLEDILDARVGHNLTLAVERLGTPVEVELPVTDLHAISPSSYLEIGRAVLHDISYQQARNHGIARRGVFLATAGFMFGASDIPDTSVITHLDGEEVPDLITARRILESKPDGHLLRVRFALISDIHHAYERVVRVDRTWFPMRACARDDATGHWPCSTSPPPPEATQTPPANTPLPPPEDRLRRRLAPSLVQVGFDIPYPTAGVSDHRFSGVGVVVDAEEGLVLVDRSTVPVSLGSITVTFGGAVRLPAELVLLHPIHNLAVLRFDRARLGDTPVRAAKLSSRDPRDGDTVHIVGFDRAGKLVSTRSEVDTHSWISIGAGSTPRFRQTNAEGFTITREPAALAGVVTNNRGDIAGMWASFWSPFSREPKRYGLPQSLIDEVIGQARTLATHHDADTAMGSLPAVWSLGVELRPIRLDDARDRGLPDARVAELIRHDPRSLQIFEVIRVTGGTPASELLRESDLIIHVEGQPVTRFRELDQTLRSGAALQTRSLSLRILRDATEVNVEVPLAPLPPRGVERVVSWAGVIVHEPHHEVLAQRARDAGGCYVAWIWYGSPAARYGLRPTKRITQVNGVDTPNMDAFIDAVRVLDPAQPVALRIIDLDGVERVQTLKLDPHYFPTELISQRNGVWVREPVAP